MPCVHMSYICRKGVMCQDCLTAALPIVSPSLCQLFRFLANNGNGKLFLDRYFVHQQSVIQHLWRWRAPSVNLRTIRMLNSWPLCSAPAHSRVGEGVRLLWRKPIDWLQNACRRNATERRKLLKSVLCSSRAVSKCYASWCVTCLSLSTTQLESSDWRKRTIYIKERYIYI